MDRATLNSAPMISGFSSVLFALAVGLMLPGCATCKSRTYMGDCRETTGERIGRTASEVATVVSAAADAYAPYAQCQSEAQAAARIVTGQNCHGTVRGVNERTATVDSQCLDIYGTDPARYQLVYNECIKKITPPTADDEYKRCTPQQIRMGECE